MHIRTPLVLAATTALAVAGCSSTGATTAAPATTAPAGPTSTTAPASTAPVTTPPAATAAGGPTASAAPVASTRSATVKPAGGTGCPVSEATLLRAFRDSEVAKSLAPTDTLTDITCYQGYALGLTHPRQVDNAEVVFHYTGGAWRAVNGGTSEYCDDVVPASVRPHLKHC